MKNLKNAYEGWGTESHRKTFDVWNKKTDFDFMYSYGCFAEQIYLQEAMQKLEDPSILDVGCATGTTYRFLKNVNKSGKFKYTGIDLSQPAINRARGLYENIDFRTKEHENILEFVGRRFDIVYSRDTILHQVHPYDFLKQLLDAAGQFLIVRLRTRDHGATVTDVEISCQMHYDNFWMPYIVLNIDELIDFLKNYPRTSKITLNRSYEVLGGQNFRFLPKELYLTKTGGAETSVIVNLSDSSDINDVDVVFENRLEGHAFLRHHRMRTRLYAIASRFTMGTA